jgi:hypothetical protein
MLTVTSRVLFQTFPSDPIQAAFIHPDLRSLTSLEICFNSEWERMETKKIPFEALKSWKLSSLSSSLDLKRATFQGKFTASS